MDKLVKYVSREIPTSAKFNKMVDAVNGNMDDITDLAQKVGGIDDALAAILGTNEVAE